MIAGNISKETKVLTVLNIEGLRKNEIVDFMGHLINPEENAIYLCTKYLNLPGYEEMAELYDQFKKDPLEGIPTEPEPQPVIHEPFWWMKK